MDIIVMAYHDREPQLLKTLESFRNYPDIEVVIVNDSDPVNLPDLPFNVDILQIINKYWINPGVNFNIGFSHALTKNPDNIIIQNPECYHVGDIISSVRQRIRDDNYLSFACYSLSKDQDVNFREFNKRTAVSNGDSAWYNHSKYRPEALHFCCALKTANLRNINGFDENFANGLGYEDDYLVHQIKTLGLKIEFIDDPFVLHQYHYDRKAFTLDMDLYNRTKLLCDNLKRRKTYRAEHFITDDL